MAHHLYARFSYGQTLVVARKPHVLMSALRKQWLKVMLKLRNEYSRTLDAGRKERIGQLIVRMQNIPFIVGLPVPQGVPEHGTPVPRSVRPLHNLPAAQPHADIGIFFIQPSQIADLATTHRTIYAVNLPDAREALKEHLVYHGLLVEYEG
jgi:hypothetical protein